MDVKLDVVDDHNWNMRSSTTSNSPTTAQRQKGVGPFSGRYIQGKTRAPKRLPLVPSSRTSWTRPHLHLTHSLVSSSLPRPPCPRTPLSRPFDYPPHPTLVSPVPSFSPSSNHNGLHTVLSSRSGGQGPYVSSPRVPPPAGERRDETRRLTFGLTQGTMRLRTSSNATVFRLAMKLRCFSLELVNPARCISF